MKPTFIVASLLAMAAVSMTAQAQSHEEKREQKLKDTHHVIFMGQQEVPTDSIQQTIDLFYRDQFLHYRDPRAPYFLLMSKDARYAMGIGGVVAAHGWANFNGAISGPDFTTYDIPVPNNPLQRRGIGASITDTQLYFRIIGRNTFLGNMSAYIQAKFQGPDNTFKLKRAYVTVQDWTVGYDESTFSDPQTYVPTIDDEGSSAQMSSVQILVRYAHQFKKHWQVAVSAEMPDENITVTPGVTAKQNSWMPDFAAFLQYGWGHNNHVRLSGIVRTLSYRNLLKEKDKNVVGWGAQFSTVFHPFNNFTVYGGASYGRGYQTLLNDLADSSSDLLPDLDSPGKLYAPAAMGFRFGLQYNWTEKWYSCVVVSQVRSLPDFNPALGNEYKFGQYFAANVFFEPTPRLQFGAEILMGRRENFDLTRGHANRFDVLAQFSF